MATRTINIDTTAKTARVVDLTDYTALGIDLASLNAQVIGTATGPNLVAMITGTIGSALINLWDGETESAEFDVPVGTDLKVLNGSYSLLTSLYLQASNVLCQSVTAGTGGAGYFLMANKNWTNVLRVGDTITITDSTASNNGTKTVTAVTLVGSDTQVYVSETLNVEVTGSSRVSFAVTHTNDGTMSDQYSGCDVVTPVVTGVCDAYNTQFGTLSFSDSTILPSGYELTQRDWSIAYPQNLNPSPTTDPYVSSESGSDVPLNETVSFNQVASGVWNYRMTHYVSVTQSGGLIYTYTADTGAQPYTVYWLQNICAINSCYASLIAQEEQEISSQGQSSLTGPLDVISRKMLVLMGQMQCGDNSADVAQTALEIQALINETGRCTCSCSGASTGNQWINNGGSDSQGIIDQLVTDVEVLQEQINYNPIIFYSTIPFADDENTLPPTGSFDIWQPMSGLSAITIPPSYFDANPTNYGTKWVEVELTAYVANAGEGSISCVRVGSPATEFLEQVNIGADCTMKCLMRFTTKKDGADTLGVCTTEIYQFSNDDSNDIKNQQDMVQGNAIWDLSSNLVLDFTPKDPTKQSILNLKIQAVRTIA